MEAFLKPSSAFQAGKRGKSMTKPSRSGHRSLSSERLIALSFLVLILLGALLLTLPGASRSGRSAGFLSALFTAASASCVTGLSLFDTYTQWSPMGQIVILCLIQIGGLGFMSFAAIFVFILDGRFGMRDAMVFSQTLGEENMSRIRHLQGWMLRYCLLTELFGAAVLCVHFLPAYGFRKALQWGVFHSVSAFCNAGFDLFGFLSPGSSLTCFHSDPVVLLTLSFLIITGGVGFLVWEEIFRVRRLRRMSVYTRLALIATGTLLLAGTVLTAVFEWNNPRTLGPLPVWEKLLNAFFQSVTLRTAGFSGIDQAGLSDAGKSLSMFLMLVGGSSGSTAGGLKTVTMVVLFLFLYSKMRGRSAVVVFKRTIPMAQITNALSIFGLMISLCFLGTLFLSANSPVTLEEAMFESVSAIATVGLSLNTTARLAPLSQVVIILFMYFGRVGVLTLSLGFLKEKTEPRYRYADTTLLIG